MKAQKTKKTAKAKTLKPKVTVTVVGHDSWSGPEILYTKEFKTMAAAERFCKKFNSKNNLPVVPEYYETASVNSSGYVYWSR